MSDPAAVSHDPIARCATRAATNVVDEIAILARENGRAATIVGLRLRARALSRSALAEDQVLSVAFEAAADDLAWGRPPLKAWLCAMVDPATVSAEARATVRASLPASGHDIASAAQVLVREIEARCALQGEDAFAAASAWTQALADVQALQASGFDDPRLRATPILRAVMRCSAERLEVLLRPAPRPTATPPSRWAWIPLWRAWTSAGHRWGARGFARRGSSDQIP